MEPAIVTIQLGQCGNQVGAACFEGLASQLLAPTPPSSKPSAASAPPVLARPSQRTEFQRAIAARFFREVDTKSNTAAAASSAESTPLPRARAVLIDMEPKVIQSALSHAASSHLFRYTAASSFYRQSGSGNNWSYGFGVHGPQCREEMMDRVRKEVERCEALGGFIVHQSLAGGTGSGVGAFLTECMHDEYPSEQLINQVVWPYANGEVIVQNYNALLTLSHLNEFSHGILLFENDSLHSICSRRLHVATPSFTQLNRIISENLTNVLLPARITQAQPFYREQTERDDPMARGGGGGSSSGSSGGGGGKTKYLPPKDDDLLAQCPPLSWSDPLSHLFAHPSYKLSTIRTIPQLNVASKSFQASTWTYLLKYLQQMQLCGADMEDSLDWAVGTYAKRIAGLGVTKRKWHQHWSASARATGLFDVGTAMVDSTSAAASIAAAASTNASSPSPSFILQDTPLPPPAYTPAFLDGESYLECRLRLDKEEESSATRRGDAQAAEDATATPYNTTLASLLYLRGSSVCSGDASSFLDPSAYASWSLNPLMVVRESKQLHGDERLATLWSNSSAVARPLDSMLDRVYSMLDAKAYVHHYEKYGIDLEWFWQQVISLEQITADYKALAYQPTKE